MPYVIAQHIELTLGQQLALHTWTIIAPICASLYFLLEIISKVKSWIKPEKADKEVLPRHDFEREVKRLDAEDSRNEAKIEALRDRTDTQNAQIHASIMHSMNSLQAEMHASTLKLGTLSGRIDHLTK